jgi:ABC-type transport system involved in multi-copper enzyme maturation permease subunit
VHERWSEAARPTFGHVLRAARFEWRLAWSRRRLRLPLLIGLLPVVVAVAGIVLQKTGVVVVQGSDILSQLVGAVFLLLVVLLPLLFGTALVVQEAEAKTLVYLLVRPLSRGSLLLGKFLGAWAAASVQLVASLAITALLLLGAEAFVSAGTWGGRLAGLAVALVFGALAYGALFTLVGLVFARPALVGLFLAFIWESGIQFMPGWIKNLTVRHHLASLLPEGVLPAGMLTLLSPASPVVGIAWLLGGTLLQLAVAVWLFARRDYP